MKTSKQIIIKGIEIQNRYVCSLPFNDSLKERAKKLRNGSTISEVLFWMQVNRRKFYGIDFDRQKIIGNEHGFDEFGSVYSPKIWKERELNFFFCNEIRIKQFYCRIFLYKLPRRRKRRHPFKI